MASVVIPPPPLGSHLVRSYSPSQRPLSSSEPLAVYLQLSSSSLNITSTYLDSSGTKLVRPFQSPKLAPSQPPSPGAEETAPFRRVLSRQHSSLEEHTVNPYSSTHDYYNVSSNVASQDPKNRTYSERTDRNTNVDLQELRKRRLSQDVGKPRQLVIEVDSTYEELLAREDTDNNGQITVKDHGPKVLTVGTAASDGYRRVDLRGTYVLSSLLQELTLAKDHKLDFVVLQEERLNESPDKRLERFIKEFFWRNLTRRIDARNILQVADDPKDWTVPKIPRIYVPRGAPEQFEYYSRVAQKYPEHNLDVQWLSRTVTPEYVRDLNAAPGLLALDMEEFINDHGEKDLRGKPFIVPGGRFNELYGWDSYMASLGLLLSDNVDICKNMVENFCFCIKHYGKILNANRTYYLGRSQPPFLTDMTLRVYDRIRHRPGALDFLRNATLAAMKEYYTIWMAAPRHDPKTGLSRYRPEGLGVPPETESTHFNNVLQPYAEKYSMSKKEFIRQYNSGQIKEPELDDYFLHDRAVRESGHDTTYRLERVAADVATVDLNSCLYKIECDIARIIKGSFHDNFPVPIEYRAPGRELDHVETSVNWDRRARHRRRAMDSYMWNEEKGMYFDYNTVKEEMSTYESATTFWALWAGVATPHQASCMVVKAVDRFEEKGGLAAGTEESRGAVGLHRPNRQWDYPFGWAPQQILAWSGLQRYHHDETAQRLAYKWAYMMTKAFHDFNGVVVEKYDVTRPDDPHEVEAEYGNQGADFKGVPREGFGWVNASYLIALDILDADQRRNIGLLVDWDSYWRNNKAMSIENTYMEQTDPGINRVRTGLFHNYSSQPERVNAPVHVMEHLRQSHAGALHHHERPGSLDDRQQAPPSSPASSKERQVEINYHDNESAIADSPPHILGVQLGRTSSQISEASSKAIQSNGSQSAYQGD